MSKEQEIKLIKDLITINYQSVKLGIQLLYAEYGKDLTVKMILEFIDEMVKTIKKYEVNNNE